MAESERPTAVPPVLFDAVLAVLVATAIGLAIAAKVEPEAADPDALAYCFAIALGALMFLRRRWPAGVVIATMLVLAVYYTLGYPAVGVSVPIAGAVYSAAEQGRLRLAILAAGAVLVVSTLYRLTEESAVRLLGFEGAQNLILLVAVIALGDSVRSRLEIRQQARVRAEQVRREHERDTRWQVEQERLRIAREVHDVLAHSVSAISIQSVVGLEALPDEPENAAAALQSIRTVSTAAMADLRGALGVLRDPSHSVLAPVGGLADLDRVVSVAANSGLQVTVLPTGAQAAVPLVVDAAAHRIVQESLTNVLRHSGSARAFVEVDYRPQELQVRISNPGTPSDGDHLAGGRGSGDQAGAGFGIAGMRERVELLGGTLRAEPTPDGGFAVSAVLPFPVSS